jgi:ABC-2 type transport system permease protein
MLRSEWLKLRRYKPFWVLLALYLFCLEGIVAISVKLNSAAHSQARGGSADLLGSHPVLQYPQVWQMIGYLASYLQFIPALLVILTVTNEITFRTYRQNILDGWSRTRFLGAKLAFVLGTALYTTCIVAVTAPIVAWGQGQAPDPTGSEYVLAFAFQTLVYQLFALACALLFRRAALALGAFLIYTALFENIAFLILTGREGGLGYYLPLRAVSMLLPAPYARDIPGVNLPEPSILAGVSLVYTGLLLGALWLKVNRDDL